MTRPIEVTNGYERWRSAALFLLTGACVVATLLLAHHLLFPIIGAITLAVVTQPLSRWLRHRWSPAWSATFMVFIVAVAVLAPLYVLIKHLVLQAIALVHLLQSGGLNDFLQTLSNRYPRLGQYMQSGMDQLSPGASGGEIAGWFAPRIGHAFGAMVNGIVNMVFLLFFYFFLVRDESAALRAWESILPLRADESFDFTRRLGDIIDAIFAGRMLIAVLQAAVAGIAYWLLGVPGALLWSFVTFVCCLIPAFGAFLAWVPICLYLGLAQSWTKSLLLAVWCGAVVSTMDNFLYPVFVGKKTDLHTGVIFVALFGGVALFGVTGFILGPVLVAASMLLLQIWKQRMAEVSAD